VVDEQISRPLSDAVKGVTGLEKVTSTASRGTSVVTVQVKYGTDLDNVQSQLQTGVNGLQGTLPDGVDSQAIAGSFDDFPVIQPAVCSDLSSEELNQATFAVAFDENADATAIQSHVSHTVGALTDVGERLCRQRHPASAVRRSTSR